MTLGDQRETGEKGALPDGSSDDETLRPLSL
jgi:hypothetical protein